MYLIQCVNAYTAVLALAEKECDYKTSYALVMLKRKLQPHIEFFVAQEMELVERYARKDDDGNVIMTERGGFDFADPSKAEELCDNNGPKGSSGKYYRVKPYDEWLYWRNGTNQETDSYSYVW